MESGEVVKRLPQWFRPSIRLGEVLEVEVERRGYV